MLNDGAGSPVHSLRPWTVLLPLESAPLRFEIHLEVGITLEPPFVEEQRYGGLLSLVARGFQFEWTNATKCEKLSLYFLKGVASDALNGSKR
jgi:hypothetical protein